jgi:hypothetical protein
LSASRPIPKLDGHPFSEWMFIQYIRNHPPYLEAVSSIRNPRKCYAVVKKST